MPTRARPTIGLAFGSIQTMGSTVKPMARRSGTTISRPLQMVGVSHWARTSRSAWVKGRSAMVVVSSWWSFGLDTRPRGGFAARWGHDSHGNGWQSHLRRSTWHPDAGGALPPDSGGYGECGDVAVSGAVPRG